MEQKKGKKETLLVLYVTIFWEDKGVNVGHRQHHHPPHSFSFGSMEQ